MKTQAINIEVFQQINYSINVELDISARILQILNFEKSMSPSSKTCQSLMEYGEPLLEVVIDEDFKSSCLIKKMAQLSEIGGYLKGWWGWDLS